MQPLTATLYGKTYTKTARRFEMALIQWDGSFSVKVAEIDQQHQKLVSMINDLNDAMKQGKGKDVLGKIVNELVS